MCSTVGCYASISLKVANNQISLPLTIANHNAKHKCLAKDESYFEVKDFMDGVKANIASNPSKPVMQVYDKARAAHRATSYTLMPDFKDVNILIIKKLNSAFYWGNKFYPELKSPIIPQSNLWVCKGENNSAQNLLGGK